MTNGAGRHSLPPFLFVTLEQFSKNVHADIVATELGRAEAGFIANGDFIYDALHQGGMIFHRDGKRPE
jgi:hypothetical protein